MPSVTSRDGTIIAYETTGSGEPLILVDGAMCYRDAGPMRPLAEKLKDRFTIVLYDRRGRGESGDTLPYSVEREVEDLEALLQAVGGSAYVYGCSSGGALALEAANRIEGIKKLIIYEAPFILDNSRNPMTDEKLAELDRLIATGRRSDAVKLFMRFVGVPALFIFIMPFMKMWAKLTAIAHTLSYDHKIVSPYQKGKPLPAGNWPNVSVPTLVADGGKSPLWMRNAQAALARNLGAQYRTLPGQTHMVTPDAQAPMIIAFLESESRREAA